MCILILSTNIHVIYYTYIIINSLSSIPTWFFAIVYTLVDYLISCQLYPTIVITTISTMTWRLIIHFTSNIIAILSTSFLS